MAQDGQQFSNKKYQEDRKGTDLTFGEKAVGLNFEMTPQNEDVFVLKRNFANVIDILNWKREKTTSGDKKRYFSKAISYLEDAQMNAVRGETWEH